MSPISGSMGGARGRVALAFVAAALAVAVCAPASAAAVTVGPNLGGLTPNAGFDCRSRPSVVGPQFYGFPDNCTYLATSANVGRTTQAPFGGGVVTAVRVKAAAPVGPMQATVVRSIGSTTVGVTCCFQAGESQVFTPRANATSTIRVRLPVANHIDPGAGISVVDYIGLTVRANNVAIPGRYPSGSGFDGSLAFFPRLTAADNVTGRVDGYGNSLMPLLNADITPLCGAGRGRIAARAVARDWPTDAVLPPPGLRAGRAGRCLGGVSIRDGTIGRSGAVVPLDCNLAALRCRGKLTLLKKRGGARLGKADLRIRPGSRERVEVKLTRAGKRAARGTGSLTARAKADLAGAPDGTATIKLKR